MLDSVKNMKSLDPEMCSNIGNLFQTLNTRKRDFNKLSRSDSGNVANPSNFSETPIKKTFDKKFKDQQKLPMPVFNRIRRRSVSAIQLDFGKHLLPISETIVSSTKKLKGSSSSLKKSQNKSVHEE